MDFQCHYIVLTKIFNFTIIRACVDITGHKIWIKTDGWNVTVQSMETQLLILKKILKTYLYISKWTPVFSFTFSKYIRLTSSICFKVIIIFVLHASINLIIQSLKNSIIIFKHLCLYLISNFDSFIFWNDIQVRSKQITQYVNVYMALLGKVSGLHLTGVCFVIKDSIFWTESVT